MQESFTDKWILKPNMTLFEEETKQYYPVYIDNEDYPESCADYSTICGINGPEDVMDVSFF